MGGLRAEVLAVVATWAVAELNSLRRRTTQYAISTQGKVPQELAMALVPWRVAGIPKKSEDESRPISVASAVVRAWLTALARALPALAPSQWACRPKTSVVNTISTWLASSCQRG